MHLLSESLHNLADALRGLNEQRTIEFEWFKSHLYLATKQDLRQMEKRIMSKISEWADRVEPKLDSVQTGIDELQRLVTEFQNSPGTLSPEDQARLDTIESKTNALATDASGIPKPPTA